jgi:prephenate dehydratase
MTKAKKVAFQGEHGAYSQQAANKFFGKKIETVACKEFEVVFNKVKSGAVDFGVLPVENALTGSIHKNYDLLIQHKIWIAGEVKLRISHHLLALPGASLKTIEKVFSHPQALSQCEGYLRKLKHVEPTPYFDTAGSAKFVQENGDPRLAAIASAEAGKEYHLKALGSSIEDNQNNFTRFIVIRKSAKNDSLVKEADKTSLVFALKNIPGALYKSLSVFAIRDIDLLKIESRPIHGSPWQYMFYLDINGSCSDEKVAKAIEHLKEVTDFLKLLGSYLRA